MSDYPQSPHPQHPGSPYPRPPHEGHPQNLYVPSPAPLPPAPKKGHLWLKISLAIVGVIVLMLVIATFIPDADSGDTEDRGAGASPSLGAAPSQVEIDTGKVGSGKVMRDSVNFQHLSTPTSIMPGAKYIVDKGNNEIGSCSFGWMVYEPGTPNQIYNLTAGHCGDIGNTVYLDPRGKGDPSGFIQIGKFVGQDYDVETLQTGSDYALIAFNPGVNRYISATPDISTSSGQKLQIVGVASGASLARHKPYTCHLGYRSGLSCGPFQKMTTEKNFVFNGISDHGDSGGVIWSFVPDSHTQIEASGIVSWVAFSEDAASTNGKTIDTVLEASGLQLLRD